jgi:hypothetical protein
VLPMEPMHLPMGGARRCDRSMFGERYTWARTKVFTVQFVVGIYPAPRWLAGLGRGGKCHAETEDRAQKCFANKLLHHMTPSKRWWFTRQARSTD